MEERINKREREREQSPFLEENVRKITKLNKSRWEENIQKKIYNCKPNYPSHAM